MGGRKQSKVAAKETPQVGRDEMRLLEFAIASARVQVDRKTSELVFTDWVRNPATKEKVERVVRVVFSAKYGRPTSEDDDVLVALITLSHMSNFESPKVYYTSEQICKILGWSVGGRQYRNIDLAFRRWLGVQIYADNFYFDSRTQMMADRHFGIIDDRERQNAATYQALRKNGESGDAVRSWFQWSPVMQESFESGMIRKLDLDFYRSIDNGVARKLYRYLCMYFWRSKTQTFDLGELTHQKLGFRAVKDSYELKRRLSPAIEELEKLGFIRADKNRFKKVGKSVEVTFVAAAAASKKQVTERKRTDPLIKELTEVGIDSGAAAGFVATLAADRIREDIDHVKLLDKRGEVKSSLAGLLFKLLSAPEPWPRPKGFMSVADRAAAKKRAAEKKATEEKAEFIRREAELAEEKMVAAYLERLEKDGKLEAFTAEALSVSSFSRQRYEEAVRAGGDGKPYLDSALKMLVLKKLNLADKAA